MAEYPLTLVLVNPVARNTWQMKWREAEPLRVPIDVPPEGGQIKRRLTIESKVTMVYYLAGLKVETIHGTLPKGSLRLLVDGDVVLEGDLDLFQEDLDPILLPWSRNSRALFWVTHFKAQLDLSAHVGFALTNGSIVDIILDFEAPEGICVINLDLHGAKYFIEGRPMGSVALA